MSSQFFGLNISYTGLLAANASLNTTANNISNVETEGYSRQQTVQQAAGALHTWQRYGMAGAGVDTLGVTQMRDEYYDMKYWNNNTSLGTYEIRQYYMEQIEDYFMETDTKQGFGAIFDEMFNALDEVVKSPGDNTVKTQYLAQAQSLCEYFGSMYDILQKVQQDANTELKNKTDEINSIAAQIGTLNKQINTIEITGVKANELRDQRALLVDQLSKIVSVEVKEVPVYISEASKEESGIYKFYVDIAGGQNLVNGYEYSTLECVARTDKINQSDADGLYDIQWSNGADFNLYGKSLGGELAGLIDIRDGNNDEYFHGNSAAAFGTDTFNGKTYSTIDVTVTADYLTDLNKTTIDATGSITLGSKDFAYDGWSYDNTTKTYTFYLRQTPTAQDNIYLNNVACVGTSVDYMGIPYYMEQMNEWVRVFAETMNEIEKKAQDSDGNSAEVLYTAADLVDGEHTYSFGDYNPSQTSWSSNQDNYYWLTAESFRVNKNMLADVSKFGTTSDVRMGQDAQDIAEELMTVKGKTGIRGCTTKEFLQSVMADIALSASSANTFKSNYTNISNVINNQRISVSGVDNDEEALNLVKFQEAYNLSAKMMQVFTEIYDRLILQTGV